MKAINFIHRIWNTPCYELTTRPYGWIILCINSLLCIAFLYLLNPMDIGHTLGQHCLRHLMVYGLIFMGSMFIIYNVLGKYLPQFFQPEHWTVGKYLLSLCGLILLSSLCVWCYKISVDLHPQTIDQHLLTISWHVVVVETPLLLISVGMQSLLTAYQPTMPSTLLPSASGKDGCLTDTSDASGLIVIPEIDHPVRLLSIQSNRNHKILSLIDGAEFKEIRVSYSFKDIVSAMQLNAPLISCSRSQLVNWLEVDIEKSKLLKDCLAMKHGKRRIKVTDSCKSTIRSLLEGADYRSFVWK